METVLRVDSRRLQCVLSDEEVQGLALELAQTLTDIEAEEECQKELREQQKSRLSGFRARVKELATSVVSKSAPRDVDIQVMLSGLQVQEVRLDTGEVIFTRPASPQELQGRLPGE